MGFKPRKKLLVKSVPSSSTELVSQLKPIVGHIHVGKKEGFFRRVWRRMRGKNST